MTTQTRFDFKLARKFVLLNAEAERVREVLGSQVIFDMVGVAGTISGSPEYCKNGVNLHLYARHGVTLDKEQLITLIEHLTDSLELFE